MFQSFRNQKRWLMLLAMILIIPAFVFIGINGYSRLNPDANAIAKVDGKGIQPEEFDAAKRNHIERIRVQQGGSVDSSLFDTPEANAAILYNLTTEKAVNALLQHHYINISEQEAINFIKNAKAFQKDGKFSPELYQNYLAATGKSDEQFVYELRRDLAKDLVINAVSRTVIVPAKTAEFLNAALREEREVRTLVFSPDAYRKDVKITEEQIQKFYDDNKEMFRVPQTLDIEYVVFSPQTIKVQDKPSQEVLKQYYEQNKSKFSQEETRRASHILIVAEENEKDAAKADAEAKAKAEKLYAEVKANPASFAEVAKENSADPGSARNGGDLDFFTKGMMVPEFENAVFSAKKGDIVGPVKSEFGYHIIEVTDVRPASIKPFEEVEPEILTTWQNQQRHNVFAENADTFSNMVYEQSESLQPVVEKFGLSLHKAPGLTENGFLDPSLNTPDINKRVIAELFQPDSIADKRNISAVEINSNTIVSARVVKENPEHIRPLSEVKNEIKDSLELSAATELARQAGEEKLKELQNKSNLAGFGKTITVSRVNSLGQSQDLISAEMAIPVKNLPAYTGAMNHEDYVISYVESSKSAPKDDQDFQRIKEELAQADSMGEELAYYDALKKLYTLEILKPEYDYKLPTVLK